MTHVLTLVSPPAQRPALDEALLLTLAAHLPSAGEPDWLDKGYAADIPFAPGDAFDNRRIAEALRLEIGGSPIDVFVQKIAHRRNRETLH